MSEGHKFYSFEEIKKKATHFCNYQERCHIEVDEKLKKIGTSDKVIPIIITQLIEENLLNETRFAQSFARGKFRIKKWGKMKIISELKKKRITEYNIKIALKEIPEEEYQKTLRQLAKKQTQIIKKNYPKNIPIQKAKLLNFLLYKGWEKNRIYDNITTIFEKK